jgi:hypothetical protein
MKAISLLSVALCSLPVTAFAHHSVAEYDRSVVRELEGEILTVHWRNPHIGFSMRIENPDGSEETWQLEAQNLNSQDRRGVPRDLLHVGDRVRAAGHSSTRQESHMFMTNILLPTGIELITEGAGEARWSESTSTVGGGNVLVEHRGDTAVEAQGIFRVWMRRTPPGRFPRDLPLTAQAITARASWNPVTDDVMMNCVAPGMPFAMLGRGPHPIDIVERNGDIVIRAEYYDIVRIIHMDETGSVAAQPLSSLGYSVGHWENDELVVRTARINWPLFDRTGVPQSEASEILERFAVSQDGTELAYDITVDDPDTFTEPVTAHWTWEWHPELEVEAYECTIAENDNP